MVTTLPALATLEPAVDAVLAMLGDLLPAALSAAEAGPPRLSLPAPVEYRTAFITEWRAVKAWPTLAATSAGLGPATLAEQFVLSWRGRLDLDCFVKDPNGDRLERMLQRYGAVIAGLVAEHAPYAGCPIDLDTLAIAPSETVSATFHARAVRVSVDLEVTP